MVVGENFDEVVQLLLVVILLERDRGEREGGGGEIGGLKTKRPSEMIVADLCRGFLQVAVATSSVYDGVRRKCLLALHHTTSTHHTASRYHHSLTHSACMHAQNVEYEACLMTRYIASVQLCILASRMSLLLASNVFPSPIDKLSLPVIRQS